MLKNKATYIVDHGTLQMYIIKIFHENDTIIKFRGILSNKYNGLVYENKNYKLPKERISHWKQVTPRLR